jgi:hypothetical protein
MPEKSSGPRSEIFSGIGDSNSNSKEAIKRDEK